VAGPKRFVYNITSTVKAATYYVGVTSDVSSRLAAHNAGLNVHTARPRRQGFPAVRKEPRHRGRRRPSGQPPVPGEKRRFQP
jgi:hypothetical protein